MDYKKDLLLRSAARLYSLGIEVEAAPVCREQLCKLVQQGVPYDSPEMRKTLEEFQKLDQQWKALEREHLKLHGEIKE